MRSWSIPLVLLVLSSACGEAADPSPSQPKPKNGAAAPSASPGETLHVASLTPADLKEFAAQPQPIQQLLENALSLTKLNLNYKYGSGDPKEGGMDCSGTMYYLLHESGLHDVPRDSSGMYRWVWSSSHFEAVVSSNPKTFELSRLKPGDLLFWTGTYKVDRDPPVTHVMLYLGLSRLNGRPVMMGASEGRRFSGKSMYGVSVFDFSLPKAKPSAEAVVEAPEPRFIGYGTIPGISTQK